MPYMVTYPDQTPRFEWCVVWCDAKNRYQKYKVQTACSIYDIHSMLNSQHNLGRGGLYDHMNLHFNKEIDVRMGSKNHEESNYDLNLDSLTISC